MGQAIGLYFRGLDKSGVNDLRARLNRLAGELGYTAQAGPTTGDGNLAALLIGIGDGYEAIVHLAGEDMETIEATVSWLKGQIIELQGQDYTEASVLALVVDGLVDALKRYQEQSKT